MYHFFLHQSYSGFNSFTQFRTQYNCKVKLCTPLFYLYHSSLIVLVSSLWYLFKSVNKNERSIVRVQVENVGRTLYTTVRTLLRTFSGKLSSSFLMLLAKVLTRRGCVGHRSITDHVTPSAPRGPAARYT